MAETNTSKARKAAAVKDFANKYAEPLRVEYDENTRPELEERILQMGRQPYVFAPQHSLYPDHKSEFIAELALSIAKWRAVPGKEAAVFATAYENVLGNLLAPEIPE